MPKFARTWCLAAALAFWMAAPSPAAPADRPIDAVSPLDRPVDIAFQADWNGTYAANRDGWVKDLAALTPDPALRDRLLHARTIRLLEAMLAHFAPTPEQRLAAYSQIAGQASALGFSGQALYYSRRIVEENPGNVDLAVTQLTSILQSIRHEAPWEVFGGAEELRYAADRVLALQRAGLLSEAHPAVALARDAAASLDIDAGRFLDARQDIDRLAAIPGHENDASAKQVRLALARGDLPQARRLYHLRGEDWIASGLPNPVNPTPDFPRQFDLESRLGRLYELAPAAQPAESLELLHADPEGQCVVESASGSHTSLWALMDAYLLQQKPAILEPLRQAGAPQAQAMLAKARAAADDGALLAVYRNFPFSAPGQNALAEYAERMLLQGSPGLALRSFRDVLAHSADPELRARCQVGLWLALAQDPGAGEDLQAAFAGLAPQTQFPFMGGQTTAESLRQRLTAGVSALASPAPAVALNAVRMRPIRTPPVSPWSCELFLTMHREFLRAMNVRTWDIAPTSDGVIIGGPNVLACFGADLAQPRWLRTAELPTPGQRHPGTAAVIPASVTLAVAEGRIYCLWGMFPPRTVPSAVAAFDRATGRPLWSTAADPAWSDIVPVGSPVYAEGRLYVVAAQPGFQLLMYLVCLDARTGATLFRRHLVSQRPTLSLDDSWPNPTECDLSLYGCSLTVRDGAVYLHTNLGVAARCDARDGLIDWLVEYPRPCGRAGFMAPRQGSPPVVAGNVVVMAPRDFCGLFALDARTGRTLWQNSDAPSQEILGASHGCVLTFGQSTLASVALADGRVLWHRIVPGLRGRPALVGSRIYLSVGKLLCLSAADGATLEEAGQPTDSPLDGLAVAGDRFYGLAATGAELPSTPLVQNPAAPATAPPPNLPVTAQWTLRRQFPDLLVPPPLAGLEDRVCISSQGLLECVQADPRGTILWRATLPLDLARIQFAPHTVLLCGQNAITALDAATGFLRWRADLGRTITRTEIRGHLLLLVESGGWEAGSWGPGSGLAALDLATGKLLWQRPAARGAHLLLAIASDAKDLLLIASFDGDDKGTFALTCRPADGVITSVRRLTPLELGFRGAANFVGLHDGWLYYFLPSASGPVYRVPLDGSQPPAPVPGNFQGMIYDWHKPDLRLSGDWLMLAGHQIFIHNLKDLSQYLQRPTERAGAIVGQRYCEFSENGITAFDLPTGKQLFQSPAAAGTQYSQAHGTPDIQGFDRGIMITGRVAGQWDGQRNRCFVALDLLDPDTGAFRARQTLDRPFGWVPTLENDREIDAQTAWVRGLLLIADSGSVQAYCATK